jgi:rod shape-determining protein MreC
MYRIADLILRYKEYVTALVLIVISMIMIATSSNTQLRSFRTISVGIIASVQSAFSWVPNPYALQTENRALRQLVRDQSLELMDLREAGIKVDRYRSLLEFKERSPLKLLSAEVIAKSVIQARNFATLNVGEKDGVREGMPVITERGLVGRIIGLSPNYSIVQLLLDRDTRLSVMTLRGRNEGMLTWDYTGGRHMLLRQIEAVRPQPKQDTIVTSGYSELFPPNINVGTIASIEQEEGSLFYKIVVTPAVDFATLDEAFVVLHRPSEERLKLETKLDSLREESEGGE